jgi:hypothetical protein
MVRILKTRSVLKLFAAFLVMGSVAMAETPCVHLTLGVNPTVVSRGGNVKATASVQNCSAEFEKLAIHFKAKGPCNSDVGLGTVYMGFIPHATRTAALSFTVPADACTGTATVTARVYYAGTLIVSSTTSLLVQ